jgi:ATP-dependent RNA helicase SUPV3L1/SUV3
MHDALQNLPKAELARIVSETVPDGDEILRRIKPKRIKSYMVDAGLRPDGPGIGRAVADLIRIEAFATSGVEAMRRRFPGLSAIAGPGGTRTWLVSLKHVVVERDGLGLSEKRAVPTVLQQGLSALALADDLDAALDAIAPSVSDEVEAMRASARPAILAFRKRYKAILEAVDADVAPEIRTRVRNYLKTHRIDDAFDRGLTVAGVLEEALSTPVVTVERQSARRRFASVVGYADHVDRLKAGRPPRRIVFHVGPTNSGKTHDAMLALAQAGQGVYLAPLRLLALEGYERLADAGLRAGMVTGEESIAAEGATHLAMTIEMAPLSRDWDVAVIDEIQMLLDPDRGWAWTRALLGVRCRTLYLCGSPDALSLVEKAARILGEEIDVVEHERKSPLRVEDRPARLDDVRAGDALVAFSRRDVLFHRQILLDRGLTVSTIYGALSPEVRRAEAARFRSGEAEVLVATDAIGMGLNLGPLRRVVFTKLDKFDGRSKRQLMPSEIRQIAGRAGRFGHHGEGLVSVLGGSLRPVRDALEGAHDPRRQDGLFMVQPEAATLEEAARELGTESLAAVLREFGKRTVYEGSHYKSGSLEETIEAAGLVDGFKLPIAEKFAFATCPMDRRSHEGSEQVRRFAAARANARPLRIGRRPSSRVARVPHTLEGNEAEVKLMSAYLWLARRFPDTFPDVEVATARRLDANALIEAELGSRATQRVRGGTA